MSGGPLAATGFRRLFAGEFVSSLGDWTATIALMALVLDLTGSPAAVGGVLALRLAPAAFAGPLIARLVHRRGRRRTMLLMNLVRAGLVVPMGFIRDVWVVYALAFCVELAGLVFLPARDAAVPELVEPEQLASANGLLMLSSYGNIPLGAGIFALVSVLLGTRSIGTFAVVFLIDAATFLVSYAALLPLDLDADVRVGSQEEEPGEGGSYWAAFRLPLVRAVSPSLVAAIVGAGSLFSLGVVFVRHDLGAGDVGFGALVALFGVGGAVGVALLRRQGEVTLAVVARATVVLGIVLAVMSLVANLAVAFAAAVGFGASGATAIIGGITLLQEQLEGDERTMGMAVVQTSFRFGMSASALLAGVLVEHVPTVRWWLVGEVPSASVVMFGAGALIAVAGVIMPREVPATRGSAVPA